MYPCWNVYDIIGKQELAPTWFKSGALSNNPAENAKLMNFALKGGYCPAVAFPCRPIIAFVDKVRQSDIPDDLSKYAFGVGEDPERLSCKMKEFNACLKTLAFSIQL